MGFLGGFKKLRKLAIKSSFLLLPFFSTGALYAQEQAKECFVCPEISPKITIDGKLDEDEWQNAALFENFTQIEPLEGSKPTEKTRIRMLCGDKSLYIGAELEGPVTTKEAPRDSRGQWDELQIILDTFLTRSKYYSFTLNPSNVQKESKDGDMQWDDKWESKTSITNNGWIAEISIPYHILKYDNKPSQEWGVEFRREIQKNSQGKNEELSYFAKLRDDTYPAAKKAGVMEFRNLPSYKRLDLLPSLLYSSANKSDLFELNSTFSTLNTDIDLLVFPHFLSTFQDIKSITPTRYEVAYPEMREFFKKIDMFSGGGHRGVSEGYLYSRRIGKVLPDGSNVPILFGLKGQTQFGKNRIGVLEVLTQEKEYIEDGEVKIEPRSLFSAGRFMHHFGTRSDVGVIYMEKRELGPDNLHSVAGIDLNLYSPNDHYLRGKVFGAFNPGKNTDDFMADFDVGQRTSRIFWNIGYSSIGKNFDPNEISYFRQPDRNNLSARGQYSWPELTGFFRSIEVGGSVSQAFNQAGDTNYGHSIRLDGEFETQGYHNLRWNISRRQDRFTANGDQLEQMFTFHSASLDFSSDRRKMLSVSIGPNIGESFDYDDGYKTYTVGIDAGLSIRTEKVQLGLSSRNNFDRPQQKMDGRESRTRGLDVISFSFFSPPHIVSLAAQNNRAYDLRTLDLLYRFEIGPRHFLNIGAGGSWYDGKRNLRGYLQYNIPFSFVF